MRLRVPLIQNVGENIEYFVRIAPFSLERGGFEEKLFDYVRRQNAELKMDRKTIDTLFHITRQFLKERSAASQIKKARIAQDWRTQRRLTSSVRKRFSEVKRRAEAEARITKKPRTSLLARAILRKTDEFLRELEDVAEFQRARELRLRLFMRSAKNEHPYVSELDAYLQHRIPWLTPEQRGLVIAGTMIASGLKSDAESKDYAANVPMARSRANRAVSEMVVSWLNQSPMKRVPKPSSKTASQYVPLIR